MRLAERQGLLQGRRINRVHRFALEILMILDSRRDAKARARQFDDQIKTAILSNNPASMVDLWPELFRKTPEPTTETLTHPEEIEEALEDTGPTTWIMPDEEVTPEEAQRIIEELTRQTSMTLTPDDLDDDTGWT